MELRIRDLVIRPAAVLAPMEGVTDLAFRRLIRQVGGCGMTWTEFVPAGSLAGEHRRAMQLVEFDADEHPIAIQIYGRDPEKMADGARAAQDLGADVLDINFGCPSKQVCNNSGGSALMREPALAREIVAKVRAAIHIPFTVKMRSGWDANLRNAPEIAWMCQEEGVEAVTIHWRTRADLYGGERNLDMIRAAVDRLSIPVIANGDVVDAPTALATLAETGAAGVMLGRGAVRNPWVFREIEAAFAGRTFEVTVDEKERVLLGYFEVLRDRMKTERKVLDRVKKLAKYFADDSVEGGPFRQQIWRSETLDDAIGRTREYFAWLRSEASARPEGRPRDRAEQPPSP